MAGKTSKYYKEHPDAARKHREYQRRLNKDKDQIEYRSELNKKRRELGIYGDGGNDISHKKAHKKGGTLKDGYILESPKKNRGRK